LKVRDTWKSVIQTESGDFPPYGEG
jgi:hypothetical protein